MALMSYLTRDRHGTYYFRRAIPPELRAFMPAPWQGKANWKRSLGNKSAAEAKERGARLVNACMVDFKLAQLRRDKAVRSDLSDSEIEALADWAYRSGMAQDDRFRTDTHRDDEAFFRENLKHLQEVGAHFETPWAIPFVGRGMSPRQASSLRHTAELVEASARAALGVGDTTVVEDEVDDILAIHGIESPADSPARRKLALALLAKTADQSRDILRRLDGKVVKVPSPMEPPGDGTIPRAAPSTAAPQEQAGPLLSEAFQHWQAGSPARGSRRPSPRTLKEAGYAVRRFTETHGDLRIGTITRETVRDFRDALARLPKRLPPELQRLPLPDLLATDLSKYPPAHGNTVNKALTMLCAIVSHAEREGRMDGVIGFRNPFGKGAKLVVDEREAEDRQPFTMCDLASLFGTDVHRARARPAGGGGDAAFWLPALALLSGARLGELVALRICDISQDRETRIWHLDIGTAGGRTIKTASSRRKVPIHPCLIEMGVLRYRQSLIDAGAKLESPLWPEVKSDPKRPQGAAWPQWFSRHLRKTAGIAEPGKVFHSFRHTFKRLARDADIAEDMHDALTGHAGNGRIGRTCGAGFGMKAMADAIARIPAPPALNGLEWRSD